MLPITFLSQRLHFGVADLTSVVSPIGSTNVLIGYGMVPLTGVPADGLDVGWC